MLRKSFVLSVLSLVLLSACRSGNETLEKQNADILAEMKRINTRLDGLEKQAKQNADIRPELKKLNAKLDAMDKRLKQRRAVSQNFIPGPVPADRNKLSRIKKLPPNPTDQQIIDYIRQIGEATEGQTTFNDTDPQIAMYKQIGPGHLRLLLPYLRREFRYNHLRLVLPELIAESDKELIRQSLDRYPDLVQYVAYKGWLREMKKEVLALLKSNRNVLPMVRNYIPVLVQTPADMKIVTDAFLYAPQGLILLDGLKKLPGVDIRKLVNQAWEIAQKRQLDWFSMIRYAQMAVQDGGPNVEAFKCLLKLLMASDETRFHRRVLTQTLIPFLSARCDFPIYDPARLREWYDKNADRIVYDPATGKYVVKK